jgi:molybdopterin-containing oxidoreductase family iron-sulfur binding subunit
MWRTLEDKNAEPEELQKLAQEEQPGGFMTDLLSPKALVSRRSFVQGSSIAALAAGLQGCVRRPENEILPYSKAPEYLVPGVSSHFATVTARGRDALGVVVTSHDGRPTKVEGNDHHPTSLGGTDVRAQAYLWDLYDPDRSQSPARRNGNALVDVSREDFEKAIDAVIKKHEADQGAGLRFLSPISNSPTFRRLQTKVLERYPNARFHTYSAVNDDNARSGGRIAYGEPLVPVYNYGAAQVIVSLASDFLGAEPGAVAAGARFASRRRLADPRAPMSRLYVVESNYTITGSMADHRARMRQADVGRFTEALVDQLSSRGVTQLGPLAEKLRQRSGGIDTSGLDTKFVSELAADLVNNQGRSIVVPGAGQPPLVHAMALAINEGVGSTAKTYHLGPNLDPTGEPSRKSIADLAKEIDQVSSLIMLGGNPVYDAPADIKFAELLGRDGLTSVHVSTHRDETSALSSWHAPLAHELEAWGDQTALDGSISFQQPLIAPLYGGTIAIELLAKIAGEKTTKDHDLVRETQATGLDTQTKSMLRAGFPTEYTSDEQLWRGALHAGVFKRQPSDAKALLVDFLAEPEARRHGQRRGELRTGPGALGWRAGQQPLGARAACPDDEARMGQRSAPLSGNQQGTRRQEWADASPRQRRGQGGSPCVDRARTRRRLRDADARLGPHRCWPLRQRQGFRRKPASHDRRDGLHGRGDRGGAARSVQPGSDPDARPNGGPPDRHRRDAR